MFFFFNKEFTCSIYYIFIYDFDKRNITCVFKSMICIPSMYHKGFRIVCSLKT